MTADTPPRPFRPGAAFTTGVNLPWLTYGGDVGGNVWWPDGGVGHGRRTADMADTFSRLADAGHQVLRWFVLCDGRAGITEDAGVPGTLDRFVRRDVDAALAALDHAGLSAVFVLLDYLIAAPRRVVGGVQIGGRRHWLSSSAGRAALIERVFRPLAAWTAGHTAVAAWDILNEPEWVTRGFGGWRTYGRTAVGADTMAVFLGDACQALHDVSPAPVTAGLASARGLPLVERAGLDFYQVHWYDSHGPRAPLDLPVGSWEADRPLLLGEYPTRGSSLSPAAIIDTARRAGYMGALAWSALARDRASAAARSSA